MKQELIKILRDEADARLDEANVVGASGDDVGEDISDAIGTSLHRIADALEDTL